MKQVKKTKTLKVLTIALGAALMLASCITFVNCEFVNDTISWVKSTGEDLIGLTDARNERDELKATQTKAQAIATADSLYDALKGLTFSDYKDTENAFGGGANVLLVDIFTEKRKAYQSAKTLDEFNAVIADFEKLVTAYNKAVADNPTSEKIAQDAALAALTAEADALVAVVNQLKTGYWPGVGTESSTSSANRESLTNLYTALKDAIESTETDETARQTAIKTAGQNVLNAYNQAVATEVAVAEATGAAQLQAAKAQAEALNTALKNVPWQVYEGDPYDLDAPPDLTHTSYGEATSGATDAEKTAAYNLYIADANEWLAAYGNAAALQLNIKGAANAAELAALKAQAQALKNTLTAMSLSVATGSQTYPDAEETDTSKYEDFITSASAAIAQYNTGQAALVATAKGQADALKAVVDPITVESALNSAPYNLGDKPNYTTVVGVSPTLSSYQTYINKAQVWYADYNAAVLAKARADSNTQAALAAAQAQGAALKSMLDAITDAATYLTGDAAIKPAYPTSNLDNIDTWTKTTDTKGYNVRANEWLAAYNTAKTAAQAETAAQVTAAKNTADALKSQVDAVTDYGTYVGAANVPADPTYPTSNNQVSTWTTYTAEATAWLNAYNTAKSAYIARTQTEATQLATAREQAGAMNEILKSYSPPLEVASGDITYNDATSGNTAEKYNKFVTAAQKALTKHTQDTANAQAAALAAARGQAEGLYAAISSSAMVVEGYNLTAPDWPVTTTSGDSTTPVAPGGANYDTEAAKVTLVEWQNYLAAAQVFMTAYQTAVANTSDVPAANKRFVIFLYGSKGAEPTAITTAPAGFQKVTVTSPVYSPVISGWTGTTAVGPPATTFGATFTYTKVEQVTDWVEDVGITTTTIVNGATNGTGSPTSATIGWNAKVGTMKVGDTVLLKTLGGVGDDDTTTASTLCGDNPTEAIAAVTRVH